MAKDDLSSDQLQRLQELELLKAEPRPNGVEKAVWRKRRKRLEKEISDLTNFTRSTVAYYKCNNPMAKRNYLHNKRSALF